MPRVLPDLTSLALFVRVAETKSLTKGADLSSIALAAASRRIAQLEHQFGTPLLRRTSRGSEPTPAGDALFVRARKIFAQLDYLCAELSDFAGGMKGVVRLQANTSALSQFLPRDLASFSTHFPDIRVALEEHRSASIAQALRERSADAGVIVEGTSTDGLTCFEYRTDQLVAVVPRSHPVRDKKVSFGSLLDFDFVGLERRTAISRVLAAQAERERKPWKLRVQVNSFDAVYRMVQAGLGIGVLPIGSLHPKNPALRLVHLTDNWATRRVLVCVRDWDASTLVTRELVQHLISAGSRSRSRT